MRTSLNEIKEIEAYLLNIMKTPDRLVFEARMLLNKKLRKDVALQRKALALVRYHFQVTVKEQFNELHQQLFTDPLKASQREKIIKLFNA